MVASLIICGSGSLPRDDDGDDDHGRSIQSATSSPRKSSSSRTPSSTRRCKSHNNHHHHSKNPYATRGLDKFSSLLAEIEEKKRMIYSKNNADEISFVQFDYSKNNNCKPIVIRVKPTKADQAEIKHHHHHQPDLAAPAPAITDPLDNSKAVDHHHQDHHQKKISLLRRLKLQKLRKPSCYLPAILILILIFLVLFGRSVAILCTSIGWYAIPTISRRKPSSRRSLEKKRSMVVGHQGTG